MNGPTMTDATSFICFIWAAVINIVVLLFGNVSYLGVSLVDFVFLSEFI